MTVQCAYVCSCVHKWVTSDPLLSQEFPLWPGKESMKASWHWGPINYLKTLIEYLIPQHTIVRIHIEREREKDSVLSSFPNWAVIDPCLMECRCSDLVFTSESWINALTVADTQSGQPRSTTEHRSRPGCSNITGSDHYGKNLTSFKTYQTRYQFSGLDYFLQFCKTPVRIGLFS